MIVLGIHISGRMKEDGVLLHILRSGVVDTLIDEHSLIHGKLATTNL